MQRTIDVIAVRHAQRYSPVSYETHETLSITKTGEHDSFAFGRQLRRFAEGRGAPEPAVRMVNSSPLQRAEQTARFIISGIVQEGSETLQSRTDERLYPKDDSLRLLLAKMPRKSREQDPVSVAAKRLFPSQARRLAQDLWNAITDSFAAARSEKGDAVVVNVTHDLSLAPLLRYIMPRGEVKRVFGSRYVHVDFLSYLRVRSAEEDGGAVRTSFYWGEKELTVRQRRIRRLSRNSIK